jgi:plastocyanin
MALLAAVASCGAQEVTLSGKVVQEGGGVTPSASVIWLSPDGGYPGLAPMHAVLTQKDKTFAPHLLVITRGSTVEFPNRDPWFHNVFSLFNGKRFDLGLYEAGSSRTVHFDREGVSFIFCNIHPEMSAVIVVVGSPYFAVPNKLGEFSLAAVPAGRYTLHVWNESALPASLQALSRDVTVSGTAHSLGAIHIPVTKSPAPHKNKYGQDYEPASPSNPVYVQP